MPGLFSFMNYLLKGVTESLHRRSGRTCETRSTGGLIPKHNKSSAMMLQLQTKDIGSILLSVLLRQTIMHTLI